MNHKPFIIKYRSFWANIQGMLFYPFQNLGPFVVAAMPALFTGHSVYNWYDGISEQWLALLISVVVAIAMESININVVHTSLDLFEQKHYGRGSLMGFFSVVVMSIVSIVIFVGEGALPPLIKGLAVASPWLTGIVYLAVGFGQSINKSTQLAEKSESFEHEKKLMELKATKETEAAQRLFEEKLALQKLANKQELALAKVSHQGVPQGVSPGTSGTSEPVTLETLTPEIIGALEAGKPNWSQFARDNGIGRRTLYRYLGTLHDTGVIHKNGNGYELIKGDLS